MQRTSDAGSDLNPDVKIAKQVLPGPLLKAIEHVFSKNLSGVALVGGTALAGFYAGHRRSDDLDLFVADEFSKMAAILAVESLRDIGTQLTVQTKSAHYYRCFCRLDGHSFTVDVVMDANLFQVGQFHSLGHVHVAQLPTLFKMKIATLVSRCSEKDLFDLIWLFDHFPDQKILEVLKVGKEVDSGISIENILISLTGSILREEACDFGIQDNKSDVFKKIQQFKKQLIILFREQGSGETDAPLKQAVKTIKKMI
jgi:predicted nucleotidyltransferase component of viral defense system